MRAAPIPESLPQPGQVVAWRHPRRALALGRFNAYGPGPFEVVAVVRRAGPCPRTVLVIRTEFGDKEIEPEWLGLRPVDCPLPPVAAPSPARVC